MIGRIGWILAYLGLAFTLEARADDCKCTATPFWGSQPGTSIRVGVSFGGRVTEKVQIGAGVGLTLTWGGAITARQECTCVDYCCPDPEVVRPTVIMSSIPLSVEMPGPLDPRYRIEQKMTVSPVPIPDEDVWECQDCEKEEVPRACRGTRGMTYRQAGVSVGLSFSASVAGKTVTVGFSLPGPAEPEMTILLSPCRAEESPKNRRPFFSEVPASLCLAPGQSVDIVLHAYDPDGPDDIAFVEPSSPWPEGISGSIVQDRIVQWRLEGAYEAVWAREVTFRIEVDEAYTGTGGELQFLVFDRERELALVEVPFEVIWPIEIRMENPTEYWEQVRARDGRMVSVLVQEFDLVINDPNCPNPLCRTFLVPWFAYCIRTKSNQGRIRIDSSSEGFGSFCAASEARTKRRHIKFVPDPDAQEEEDEVVVEVSHYGCQVVFTKNGFPVKVVVNTMPETSVSPSELTTRAGGSVRARVIATDPDGDWVTLVQTSGPGAFTPVTGEGEASGTWSWTVPQAYGGSSWRLAGFRAEDAWGGSSLAYLLVRISTPPRLYCTGSKSVMPVVPDRCGGGGTLIEETRWEGGYYEYSAGQSG
ncbi:MAG: hypothetical protein BIP78_1320 [Candidatus Bipolaricaulis sibiricus]|uniref:Uncharacterized protein n=1 Tax=Bipolaricaulis sibiricus TaxID=2501609 RepID=A0A410FVJ1_BIPS1|nr:MAG: hypothetical protein BIP78_1320 [Candidatus Bipolaricaulis sibiricus]